MEQKVRIIFAIIVYVLFASNIHAQQKIVEGVVTTFDSIKIIGAEITVKSTKQTVLTDTLGEFKVRTSNVDKLKVKAEGFFTQKIKLEENMRFAAINLKLKPGEKNVGIAVGYGHVADRDKLSAVAAMHANDPDFSQYTDMFQLIKGRFAGVQVTGNQIIIRGINSFGENANNAALIVVDGVPTGGDILSNISPTQVKSIKILKGGETAIYGVRGANGVVLVETKSGRD